MIAPGRLYTISAPSGAGKTSLVNALVKSTHNIQDSISYTTRPARSSEVEGVDYYFVSNEKFDQLLAENIFLEHAEVFGHRYGTSRAWVEERLSAGIDVILEIDWQGARAVSQILPETVSIFIFPPSKNALESRLRSRAQDSEEVIQNRLAKAREEMSHYQEYKYIVINNDFATALADLQAIVRSNRLLCAVQQQQEISLISTLL